MTIVSSVPARTRGMSRGYFLAVVALCGAVGGGLAIKAMLPRQAAVETAPSITSVDAAFYRVNVLPGGAVEVGAHLKNAPNVLAYVDLAGMAARAAGKALQRGVGETVGDAGDVVLAFDIPSAPLMTLHFRAADLRAMDYTRAQWPDVLDHAQIVTVADAGVPIVRAWCAGTDHAGSQFCAKALAK